MITKVTRTRGCRCSQCFGRKARVHGEVTETVWVAHLPGGATQEFRRRREAAAFVQAYWLAQDTVNRQRPANQREPYRLR